MINYHIITAIQFGMSTELEQIVKENYYDINGIYHGFYTPLEYACELGENECAKILLESGASIYKNNVLALSTFHKRTEIIILIKEQMIKDLKFFWSLISFDVVKHIVTEYI